MAKNEVQVKVATDVEDSKVDALERKIDQLRREKLQWEINVATQKLDETKAKIEALKQEKATLQVGVDDSRIDEINAEIAQLEGNAIDLQLSIDTSELRKAEAEIEEIDGKTVDIDANMSMQNISQGISQAKQGISELKQNMDEVAQAGMQSEQNKAFLEMNLGAEKARDTYQQISDIVASMPGDDNTMRSVLSTAQALGNNLNPDEMKAAAGTMADYMSGSATMGKQALESQQDIMKYLLDGNTAELEKGSIVSKNVDKLKEATTFQERQKAMQEVLNELGYGGIAQQDTMLNKQAEWEGMIYNSQDALSSMWLGAEKGAMDYILQLNDATKGLLGMGIVAGQMVTGPFVEIMSGIGQIGIGLKTIKEGADFTGLTDKLSGVKEALLNVKTKALDAASSIKGGLSTAFSSVGRAASNLAGGIKSTLTGAFTSLKTTMTGTVIPALRNVATSFLNAGRAALTAGLNALRSAGMWLAQKIQMIASTVATWAATAAQTALNIVMDMNPIMLVVLAIMALIAVLAYLYFNNEQVRAAIDGLGQTLMMVGQIIYDSVVNAINWLVTSITNLWNTITSTAAGIWATIVTTVTNITSNILAFITFFATLPGRIGSILSNVISRAISFASSFISNLIHAGSQAASNFINYISQLPGQLASELQNMLSLVGEWAATLPAKFWEAGVNAVKNFLSALGIASPGTMQRTMVWEVSEMARRVPIEGKNLVSNIGKLGTDIVDEFGNPTLGMGFDTANESLTHLANGSVGNHTINLTLEIGSVDNEKRIQEIVEAVRRELRWNNKTAGRGV